MKVRFDTYTKSLALATETYLDIMSGTRCTDLNLQYNEYNRCYNLMGSIHNDNVPYVAGLLNDGNWDENYDKLDV